MAVKWATMVYEVTPAKALVLYIVCHDINVELVFKVTILAIGVDARVSSMREEHLDSVFTIFYIYYAT